MLTCTIVPHFLTAFNAKETQSGFPYHIKHSVHDTTREELRGSQRTGLHRAFKHHVRSPFIRQVLQPGDRFVRACVYNDMPCATRLRNIKFERDAVDPNDGDVGEVRRQRSNDLQACNTTTCRTFSRQGTTAGTLTPSPTEPHPRTATVWVLGEMLARSTA